MSTEQHASDRRRVYLALREHPSGITAPDLEQAPTVDGGPVMTRVAARIGELREELPIPLGERRGKFALYRLAKPGETLDDPAPSNVVPMTQARVTPRRVTTSEGWVRIAHCVGCLSNHHHGFVCPHGHRIEERLLGSGPADQACQRQTITDQQEEQRAA